MFKSRNGVAGWSRNRRSGPAHARRRRYLDGRPGL